MKTLVAAVIGMMATSLILTTLNAQTASTPVSGGGGSEPCPPSHKYSIPGCGEGTSGYSTITGESCSGNVLVSTAPDQLPIDDIESYAWERVSYISLNGWAGSLIHATQNDRSSLWTEYPRANGVVDVEEIFDTIRAQKLLLSVLYPSDSINLYAGLHDEYGNTLFYSSSSAGINPPQNGVSKNILNVEFQMNSDISIPFPGARWFEIVERDDNGNPVRYYHSREYDIQNGMIRFPAYFSKKGGELRITTCDGTEVAYSLKNSKRIIPTTVSIGIGNVSAQGTRTFRDTNLVYVEVSAEEFQWNINPLSQVVVSTSGLVELASTVLDSREVNTRIFAQEASVWLQGQPSSTAWRVQSSTPSHRVATYLSAGRYWIKFGAFPSGWPYGNQFYPPWNGHNSEAVSIKVEEK